MENHKNLRETSKVLASLVTFNQEGNTPVQLAIRQRHFDVIEALLRPLKECTSNEQTSLFIRDFPSDC